MRDLRIDYHHKTERSRENRQKIVTNKIYAVVEISQGQPSLKYEYRFIERH